MKTSRILFAALWVGVFLAACRAGPDVPEAVSSLAPSFEGNCATSGVLSVVRDREGRSCGWIVSARARARYNALIEKYGTLWTPPIRPDHGVSDLGNGFFLMTNEAMEKFALMSVVADAQ